jgi:hypothetical protein
MEHSHEKHGVQQKRRQTTGRVEFHEIMSVKNRARRMRSLKEAEEQLVSRLLFGIIEHALLPQPLLFLGPEGSHCFPRIVADIVHDRLLQLVAKKDGLCGPFEWVPELPYAILEVCRVAHIYDLFASANWIFLDRDLR